MSDTLPLKKITIREGDYFRPGGGGGGPKVFGAVTSAVRQRLAGAVHEVESHFVAAFDADPNIAAVARVALKDEALAKSHRPVHLLEAAECPVVGIGQLGELLVSVRKATLPRLERTISSDTTRAGIANISTIQRIEPFRLADEGIEAVKRAVQRRELKSLKLRLFRHGSRMVDEAVEAGLTAQLRKLHIEAESLNYGSRVGVYRLHGVRPEHVEDLARYVGTQSLGAFPEYHIVRPAAQPVGKLSAAHLPAPDPKVSYPTVGLIDSGIDPSNAFLNAWVTATEDYVDVSERDYEHGSFVAGLLVHARSLNHDDARFPRCPCKIVDVIAIPRSRKITEDELLAILWEVVPKHPEVRVWNLSLAGKHPCGDHAFSDLAIALDELQAVHNVTFVLAAGNYEVPPFRQWPASGILGEADRVCGPGDSVRALTVGSVAHRDSATSRVRASEPSPFSRRGPGPVFLAKPEVTHYGGNCDQHGRHAQIGVLSVDGSGNLAESMGTSFAAPTVAAVLAHVQHRPTEPLSNAMSKALVVHSAALGNGPQLSADDLRYHGYGVPGDPGDILACEPWRATLLFEFDVRAGIDVQLVPFAVPACLITNGALRGEMTVTLASEPPLDGTFGPEYCRTNVDVSLGTYDVAADGTQGQKRQIHPFPTNQGMTQYERGLVEHGFKWSPVKVYRRAMPRGVKAQTWRLVVSATDRSGAANASVRVALVVTIAALDRTAPVYNDVVTAVTRLGWLAQDVQVRERIRAA